MTTVTLMLELKKYIELKIKDYYTESSKKELVPIEVYAGYPPQRDSNKELPSFVYVLVNRFGASKARVEIGFNIEVRDAKDSGLELFNLLEHVRQALLTRRCIANWHRIDPESMKGEILPDQRWPQWQAVIEVEYSIAEPDEELMYV